MKLDISKMITYLLVFYLIYCFNTPVYAFYYKYFIVINLFVGIFILIIKRKRITRKGITVWFLLTVFSVFAQIVNLDFDITTAIATSILVIFAVSNSIIISRQIFEEIFVKIMTWISALSLIIYMVALVIPGFVGSLPVFSGTGEYPTIGYVFFLPARSHISSSILIRNEGMFCEMGIFACLIIFAIIIILNDEKKQNKFSLIILLVTLMTTLSTTGVLSVILLFPEIYRKYFKGSAISVLLVIALVGVLLIKGDVITKVLFSKLNPESQDFGSFYIRFSGTINDLKICLNNPWGIGINKYLSYNNGSANTITYLSAIYGILFGVLMLWGCMRFFCRNKKMLFGFFRMLSIIICLSTQGMTTYPLFYLFVIYGFLKRANKDKYYEDVSDIKGVNNL